VCKTTLIALLLYFSMCIMLDSISCSHVMVRVLASSAVDDSFEHRSGQTKDYRTIICCFSAKHTALRRKGKYWLAWNQDNVSEWSNISTSGLLFQLTTLKIQLSVLVHYKVGIIIISSNWNVTRYSWNFFHLVLNVNHSLSFSFTSISFLSKLIV
jgi:hypothetical protein